MKNKCLTEEQVARYIDGLASDIEQQLIVKHCKECKICANEIAAIMKFSAMQDFESDINSDKDISLNKPSSDKSTSGSKFDHQNGGVIIPLFTGGAIAMELKNSLNHPMPMVAGIDENIQNLDRNSDHHNSINVHDNLNSPETFNNMGTQINQAPNQFGEEAKLDVSSHVYQGYSDTCAIRSQQLVLNDFGIPVTQEDLISEASQNEWYAKGGGTPIEYTGNLLENHGVAVNRVVNANIYNITNELAQGHKVIIGVDANELWHNGFWQHAKDFVIGETPNHALIVAGIDTSDPSNVQVILKDSGTGDVAKPYPMAQFMDAWKDSNCFMVSTQEPAPLEYNQDTMMGFDYKQGHIQSIGNTDYEHFQNEILTHHLGLTENHNLNINLHGFVIHSSTDNFNHDESGNQFTDNPSHSMNHHSDTDFGHSDININDVHDTTDNDYINTDNNI